MAENTITSHRGYSKKRNHIKWNVYLRYAITTRFSSNPQMIIVATIYHTITIKNLSIIELANHLLTRIFFFLIY